VLSYVGNPSASTKSTNASTTRSIRLAERLHAEITLRRGGGCSRSARPVPNLAGWRNRMPNTTAWCGDPARRQGGRRAAMRAHIELVRDEYELYAVSV